MGRKISQPINELMSAVERIRQHDLNFSITYTASNELGDLCSAVNELRQELQDSLEREWRKQEEMQTMIAALAHDLRTPVTIIQGHIEGLARAEAGEKRNQRLERYLPALEASGRSVAHLLNDLLLLSELEQTSFVIQPYRIALDEELARRAELYTLRAAEAGITFQYSLQNPASHSLFVMLDSHRLEQVLGNLFDNAVRHTPTGGQISLTCTRTPNAVEFVLRDNGSGIAPEDLPHIWERFHRSSATPNVRSKGNVGLGLSICKLLVERQGGTIALQNHPEGGCEATVILPVE
jgi:signal transduction histidine kinase